MLDSSEIDPAILELPGMSGRKYRLLINNLIRALGQTSYLEIGTWSGSTLCSAIYGNAVRATAIDNWSQFGAPKEKFFENLRRFCTSGAKVNVIENDFRKVDFAAIGTHAVYLFDGPHEYQDQYDGLCMALPALDQRFVFIVDDWNWKTVRQGTMRAIGDVRLSIDFMLEIRTTLDESHAIPAGEHSDWHNGLFIGVLAK
jgi:hypothetical protein